MTDPSPEQMTAFLAAADQRYALVRESVEGDALDYARRNAAAQPSETQAWLFIADDIRSGVLEETSPEEAVSNLADLLAGAMLRLAAATANGSLNPTEF